MNRTPQQVEGQLSEEAALAYLQARGLALVERNFLCKAGELDLIMRDGPGLVFVEVRKRAGRRCGADKPASSNRWSGSPRPTWPAL